MAKDQTADQEVEGDVEYDPNSAPQSEATEGLQYEDGEGFSFNMKDEKASSGFPLFPAGTYDAVAEDCQFQISKNSGNPMWAIKWNFEVEGKTRKLTSYVVFSPEQRGRAKMFLKRVAPELADLEQFDPRSLASQISGKRARVKINVQKGQDDEDRNNVADVLAPSAGAGGSGFNL